MFCIIYVYTIVVFLSVEEDVQAQFQVKPQVPFSLGSVRKTISYLLPSTLFPCSLYNFISFVLQPQFFRHDPKPRLRYFNT